MAQSRAWKRSTSMVETTAAENERLSWSGLPGPLSMSGSIPETLHSPPASTQAGSGKP